MNATLTWAVGTFQQPITSASTTFHLWLSTRVDKPGDEDGSAGVREPRRPLPSAPTMTMALA